MSRHASGWRGADAPAFPVVAGRLEVDEPPRDRGQQSRRRSLWASESPPAASTVERSPRRGGSCVSASRSSVSASGRERSERADSRVSRDHRVPRPRRLQVRHRVRRPGDAIGPVALLHRGGDLDQVERLSAQPLARPRARAAGGRRPQLHLRCARPGPRPLPGLGVLGHRPRPSGDQRLGERVRSGLRLAMPGAGRGPGLLTSKGRGTLGRLCRLHPSRRRALRR